MSAFPEQSFSQNNKISKQNQTYNQQLCYLINNHIRNAMYDYQRPFFYFKSNFTDSIMPLILVRHKSWNLVGIKTNIDPLTEKGTLTEWYTYKSAKKKGSLNHLCRPQNNQRLCLFRVLYSGHLAPKYILNTNSVKFVANANVKVSIFAGSNNRTALVFPKDCKNIKEAI